MVYATTVWGSRIMNITFQARLWMIADVYLLCKSISWFYCVHLARRWKPVHDGKVEESTQLSLYSSQFRATSESAQTIYPTTGKSTLRNSRWTLKAQWQTLSGEQPTSRRTGDKCPLKPLRDSMAPGDNEHHCGRML